MTNVLDWFRQECRFVKNSVTREDDKPLEKAEEEDNGGFASLLG